MEDLKRYCESGDVNWLVKVSREIREVLLLATPHALKSHEKGSKYYNRGLDVLDVLFDEHAERDCDRLRGLYWVGMSCYVDSALFSLLVTPTEFVSNQILNADLKLENRKTFVCAPSVKSNNPDKIKKGSLLDLKNRKVVQERIKEIFFYIQGRGERKKYCTDLRKALAMCPNEEKYHGTDMGDASDFLTYIFSMFDTDLAVKRFTTYGTDNLSDTEPLDVLLQNSVKTSDRYDRKSSVIQHVPVNELEFLCKDKAYDIRKFLTYVDDSGELDEPLKSGSRVFKRKISIERMISAPFLIIRLERLNDKNQLIYTKVLPTRNITLKEGGVFQLSSIVVYMNKHYTAYFKCGTFWYYYDDNVSTKIKKIGDYDHLLSSSPSPLSNGTMYYYTPFDRKV